MRVINKPDTFRQNIRSRFSTLLKLDESSKLSRNIEIGIFNYCHKEAIQLKIVKKWDNPYFVQLYLDRLKSVFENLKSNKLSTQLVEKHIQPEVFAFMNHQEMDPDNWKEHIEMKMKRDKSLYETRMVAATDTFTCRKCKSNECTYYQMQTRSADEPMTTFVTCINCGNRWKC
jgi:transcription elongation factor S-II